MRVTKRQARKEALSKGYRSNFEFDIAKYLEKLQVPFEYETVALKYTVPETLKTYHPDWLVNGVLYEAKGLFSPADRKKMLFVRDSNPGLVIRLIFQNSQVKIRKGSSTTYADWATKNGMEWCDFRDKRKLQQWFKFKGVIS
jgi:hypothetical protein